MFDVGIVLFLGLLDLNAPDEDVEVAVIIGYLYFCLDELPLSLDVLTPVLGLYYFIEYPVLEKSAVPDFNSGAGLVALSIEANNSDGFGRVVFFLELGLTLMSGKND
jgi:hypothetical protein